MNGFIWYDLTTSDPDAASAFYEPIVGWKFMRDPEPTEGVDYRHIIRHDGKGNGGVLKIDEGMTAMGAIPHWIGYLFTPDLDATVAAVVADGGKAIIPKITIDEGSFALLLDPWGVPHYAMTPTPADPDAKSDAFHPSAPQHISWNELACPDPAAAKAFYARHYGFEFKDSMPPGPMGSYDFISIGEDHIGAVMKRPESAPAQTPAGWWNFYIRVEDIDVAAAQVTALGGQLQFDPQEVPTGDWVLHGFDPQGAHFAMVGARQVGSFA